MAGIRPSRTGNSAGFTLTELLVVLAIIGLLIVATPTLIQAGLPGARAAAEARALASNLRAMRAEAIAQGYATRVVFEPFGRAFTDEPGHSTHTLRGGVHVGFDERGAANPGREIVFYPDGSSSGGAVFVGNQRFRHRVATDWLTGRVSVDE
jgi:general secretion pathway protein H